MALIQRYSTELLTRATLNRQITDDQQSIEHILNNVATIKQQDDHEKRYLHDLNNRLEELLRHLADLERANKHLRDELNGLISNWGIGGEHRARFLHELDEIIQRTTDQNRQKILHQAEAKIFEELTQLTDRIAAVFIDVTNMYRDKHHILIDLHHELDDEHRKIQVRLDLSEQQVKSHEDDYQKELKKFRSYLNEWSQLALEKQHLLNEIQSLKERYNLRLAYNQEEINEWQRLLSRISQESKNFYRDYLDTVKQQIQIDYEQMAKDQQMDVEVRLKTHLKEVQDKIDRGLPMDENDERRRQEETQRFQSRLDEQTKQFEDMQQNYRRLAEENQQKRRIVQDLENDLRNKSRKLAEEHARLERDTDLTRAEYYSLKDELDKLAYTLRFSVEEELKIYEALLNSLNRKKDEHSTKRMIDQWSSGSESTGFHRSQPNLSETTRILTTKSHLHDSTDYRTTPPPPPLLTETSRTFITTKSDDSSRLRQSPLLSDISRTFTSTKLDDPSRYRSTPLLTETRMSTTTTSKTVKNDHGIPTLRVDPPEKINNQWTYETVSSGTTSSSHGDSDRDRSAEKKIIPTRTADSDRYTFEQNMFGENRTSTTTTRTTRRVGQELDGSQSQQVRSPSRSGREYSGTPAIPEIDEKLLESKIHITRKYKGNVLIKFVDVNGRFVEIENTGNQARDLTGWYIERVVDGRRIEYTFPVYELDAHKTVRIYGNYHRRLSATDEDHQLQLIASNFYDWGTGRIMKTELFNRDDVAKALFEQTIRD